MHAVRRSRFSLVIAFSAACGAMPLAGAAPAVAAGYDRPPAHAVRSASCGADLAGWFDRNGATTTYRGRVRFHESGRTPVTHDVKVASDGDYADIFVDGHSHPASNRKFNAKKRAVSWTLKVQKVDLQHPRCAKGGKVTTVTFVSHVPHSNNYYTGALTRK